MEVANYLKLTIKVILERAQQKLRDEEARARELEPLTFGSIIAESQRIVFESFKKRQWERSDFLRQTQEKIAFIQRDVIATAAPQEEAYKKWDEYIRTA